VFLSSTGNPAAKVGSYPFTPQVTDSAGNRVVQPLTLVVCPFQVQVGVDVDLIWTPGQPPMQTSFTTPPGFTSLLQAANACGFSSFDWVQTIDQSFGGTYAEIVQPNPIQPTIPYLPDPLPDPPYGGYTYQFAANWAPGSFLCTQAQQQNPNNPNVCMWSQQWDKQLAMDQPNFQTAYPLYYSPQDLSSGCEQRPYSISNGSLFIGNCILPISDTNTLNFRDVPENGSCIGTPPPAPGGPPQTAANSCFVITTQLVGVCNSSNTTCNTSSQSLPLFQWTWNSNWNGRNGGGYNVQTASLSGADPGTGTGGVTVTNINGVQLPTALWPSQVTTTASGLAYSRVSQTFNGTVTITNINGSAISGPLQVLFTALPDGVTLANETGNLSGIPYLTVPAAAGLAPGQSVTVNVHFKNPSNAAINFTPAIYSGSIG
jgi:hypothetical protein